MIDKMEGKERTFENKTNDQKIEEYKEWDYQKEYENWKRRSA